MFLLLNSNRGFTGVSRVFGRQINPFDHTEDKDHYGYDVTAGGGTDVPASAGGTVVFSDANYGQNKDGAINTNLGYGYTVIIQHTGANGNIFFTLYGHMDGNDMPEVGQPVEAGETIGRVGSTGRSTGNHLHFEVLRPDGYDYYRDIAYPYFLNGEDKEFINSRSTDPWWPPDHDNGRIPIGLHPGVGRKDPAEYLNWPSSGLDDAYDSILHPSNERNGGRGTTSSGSREQDRENESSSHKKRSRTSSSSGETLERRGEKVWRIEPDGSTRGYVKKWSE